MASEIATPARRLTKASSELSRASATTSEPATLNATPRKWAKNSRAARSDLAERVRRLVAMARASASEISPRARSRRRPLTPHVGGAASAMDSVPTAAMLAPTIIRPR